jgi:diphthine synthase
MFYVIGLGLGDAEDITVKGLNVVRRALRVYLEAYTSILTVGVEALEEYYGRKVVLADREMVEQHSDEILADADTNDVAFLVVGDPFGATTHADLMLRAKEHGIATKVIHNASIMNAVGCCGLQLYSFGETVSIVFWTETWRPESFYDKIVNNLERGLHTLCLLDIKVKEQTVENLMRNKKVYEPPRFMTVAQAATQLMEVIANRRALGNSDLVLNENTVCVGVARVGSDTQLLHSSSLSMMTSVDLGGPLHSLVIVGHMHPLERDMLAQFTDTGITLAASV